MLNSLGLPNLNGLVEIFCLAVVFYYILFFFRGTRAMPVLTGFILVFIVLLVVTRLFHMDALAWLLGRFSVYLAVALLVIFQPEIRRALAELGKQHLFGSTLSNQSLVDHIVQTAVFLAHRKIGALIAVEQAIGLRAFQETGVKIDGELTPETLASFFFPHTPLHDGAVIIADNRIAAARCLFPLSEESVLSKTLGTRHRAAIGLTLETDAVVVVVSEETGAISFCHEGHLIQNLDEDRLKIFLSAVLLKEKRPHERWRRLKKFWPWRFWTDTPVPGRRHEKK